MILDKLTQRARKALLKLIPEKPNKKTFFEVLSGSVLDSVLLQEGVAQKVMALGESFVLDEKVKIPLYKLVEQAYIEAFDLKHPYVGTEHLLLALYKIADSKDYKSLQKKILVTGTYPQNVKRVVNTATKTPILDAFGYNLNASYEQNKAQSLVDRSEVLDVISVLLQQRRANVLLVGDPGVGKSSLVKLLAKKISDYEVPTNLNNTQVIEFDLASFINSVVGREGLEVGFSSLHDEVITSGDVVLFIPDIHNIFASGVGTGVPPMAAGLFKSYILYSGVQILASTTPQAFQKNMSDDEDIIEAFSVVKVKEPDKKTTLKILAERARELEKFHSIKLSDEVLTEAVVVSDSYLRSKKLPQKAIEVVDKAASLLLSEKTMLPKRMVELKKKKVLLTDALNKAVSKSDLETAVTVRRKIRAVDTRLTEIKFSEDKLMLTKDFLALAVSKELDVPVGNLSLNEENLYRGLAEKLSERVIGQEKAVKALSEALLRSRLGLRSKKRPIGNFLFLGPTGVGKTELAKVLADIVFGVSGLIKLDMSDFSEKHTVSRLVGAPPGYIGYNEGGELTEKISRNPYSVVLFDEIEKAHPDVLNILLQIMEDGTLVDAKGKAFDFTHAIVILTSNLGSELINRHEVGFKAGRYSGLNNNQNEVGADSTETTPALATEVHGLNETGDKTHDALVANLKQILKPELLNRFDDVIVFNKLSRVHVAKVFDVLLCQVKENFKEKGIKLKVTDAAKEFVIKSGYSEEYGARSLRRAIEKMVVDGAVGKILEVKEAKPSLVSVDYKKILLFEVK